MHSFHTLRLPRERELELYVALCPRTARRAPERLTFDPRGPYHTVRLPSIASSAAGLDPMHPYHAFRLPREEEL